MNIFEDSGVKIVEELFALRNLELEVAKKQLQVEVIPALQTIATIVPQNPDIYCEKFEQVYNAQLDLVAFFYLNKPTSKCWSIISSSFENESQVCKLVKLYPETVILDSISNNFLKIFKSLNTEVLNKIPFDKWKLTSTEWLSFLTLVQNPTITKLVIQSQRGISDIIEYKINKGSITNVSLNNFKVLSDVPTQDVDLYITYQYSKLDWMEFITWIKNRGLMWEVVQLVISKNLPLELIYKIEISAITQEHIIVLCQYKELWSYFKTNINSLITLLQYQIENNYSIDINEYATIAFSQYIDPYLTEDKAYKLLSNLIKLKGWEEYIVNWITTINAILGQRHENKFIPEKLLTHKYLTVDQVTETLVIRGATREVLTEVIANYGIDKLLQNTKNHHNIVSLLLSKDIQFPFKYLPPPNILYNSQLRKWFILNQPKNEATLIRGIFLAAYKGYNVEDILIHFNLTKYKEHIAYLQETNF